MHALDLPPGSNSEWVNYIHRLNPENLKELAGDRLFRFLSTESQGTPTRALVLEGHPATETLRLVEVENADFIAMPTRGLGPFDSFLFGSVTERVLHKAQCPVWTEGRETDPVTRYENVLCAVDLSDRSETVVRWAKLFAEGYGAKLNLLHVGHGDQPLAMLRELAARVEVDAECEVLGGEEVTKTILEAVERHGCELLVIGRGAERSFLGRFRSQAQTLIRSSPCAVFSV